MARRVGEIGSKACFSEYFTTCTVHFTARHAWAHSFEASGLGVAHRLVHFTMGRGNRTHMYSAGHIRTVTSEYNTPIQDYKSIVWNGLRGSPSMGKGRPGST